MQIDSGEWCEEEEVETELDDQLESAEQMLCVVSLLAVGHYYQTYYEKEDEHRKAVRTGQQHVEHLMQGHDGRFKRHMRMSKSAFMRLCDELEPHLNIRNRLYVEESVAIYMSIVGRHFTLTGAADEFEHSLETIRRYG